MEQKTIGKFIAVLRKSRGMTQKELAERLGVSDKTVSHWERDESAPDISLIPVIAEIFSVTCDELLRGEKASAQSEPSDLYYENELSEKAEKQMKYLFEKALGRLKMKSLICVGITAVGFVVSLIVTYLVGMKLGSSTEYTGLLFAVVFYIVSLALTGIFRFQFGVSVKNDNFERSQSYLKKANLVTFLTAGLTAIVFCFTLPVCDRYLMTGELLLHGLAYAAVCLAVLAVVFAVLTAKGLLGSKNRTKKQKKLFSLRMIVAVVTVCILASTAAWEISIISGPDYDDYDSVAIASCDDIDEFLDLMRTPNPIPDYADEETRLDVEEKMSQGEYSVTVDGKEYRFEWKNGEVRFFNQTDDFGEGLPIDVGFVEDNRARIEQGAMQDRVYMAGYVFYPAVILLAVLVYVLVSRKIRKGE